MKLKVIAVLILAVVVLAVSCQSDQQVEFQRYYSAGSLVYANHCQNCHGASGEGLGGLIPPLTDTLFIKNNKSKLACFLTNGLSSKITIRGRDYDEHMPQTGLPPVDIANVLTYVANSFGNKNGTIGEEQVQRNLSVCK